MNPYKRKEIIGDCTLYLGDCLEIMPTLGKVDAVVTDPPYGISLVPARGLTSSIQGDGREEAKKLWAAMLNLLPSMLKEDTAHVFWTGWSEVWTKDALASVFTVKNCIVWVKNQFGIGYYMRPQHEFAWYCHFGKPPIPDAVGSNVWNVNNILAPIHSCEKPVKLLSRCLNLVGGSTVFDPFMGSGPTGVACVELGRKFIGIEIDENYFDIACQRIGRAERQGDLFRKPTGSQAVLFDGKVC